MTENDNDIRITDDTNGIVYGSIPSGAKMYFYQATAPDGFTIVESVGDKLLAVVDSTSTTYDSTAAGNTTDDWTISGLSDAGHTHSYSGVIAHTHSLSINSQGISATVGYVIASGSPNSPNVDRHDGVGPPYAHNQSVSLGSHSHSGTALSTGSASQTTLSGTASISQDGTWRPSAAIGIIASKD